MAKKKPKKKSSINKKRNIIIIAIIFLAIVFTASMIYKYYDEIVLTAPPKPTPLNPKKQKALNENIENIFSRGYGNIKYINKNKFNIDKADSTKITMKYNVKQIKSVLKELAEEVGKQSAYGFSGTRFTFQLGYYVKVSVKDGKEIVGTSKTNLILNPNIEFNVGEILKNKFPKIEFTKRPTLTSIDTKKDLPKSVRAEFQPSAITITGWNNYFPSRKTTVRYLLKGSKPHMAILYPQSMGKEMKENGMEEENGMGEESGMEEENEIEEESGMEEDMMGACITDDECGYDEYCMAEVCINSEWS